jgi:hypothetical protein
MIGGGRGDRRLISNLDLGLSKIQYGSTPQPTLQTCKSSNDEPTCAGAHKTTEHYDRKSLEEQPVKRRGRSKFSILHIWACTIHHV